MLRVNKFYKFSIDIIPKSLIYKYILKYNHT